jgi:6,7-dimethyl-8-ribityllumazine synthase
MKTWEGQLTLNDQKIAIVAGRFNAFITEKLVEGAKDAFTRHGGSADNLELAWVPGAFEIPLMTQKLAQLKKFDAIVCLGAVIRGETSHYDYVCNEASKGIGQLSLQYELPIMFGVLTTETVEQAIDRSGSKAGNKGFEVMVAAIEMINVLASVEA